MMKEQMGRSDFFPVSATPRSSSPLLFSSWSLVCVRNAPMAEMDYDDDDDYCSICHHCLSPPGMHIRLRLV